MCITATQKYQGCKCTVTRHLICSDHVAHTHRQVDNLPCYNLQFRFVETVRGGCGAVCSAKMEEKWIFDHWGHNQSDFTFLEKGVDLRVKQPKCLDESGFTSDHRCGIGKSMKGAWRHLNEKGEPKKGVEKEVEKDEKGNGKEVEVAGDKMEIENEVDVEMEAIGKDKGEDVEMRQ